MKDLFRNEVIKGRLSEIGVPLGVTRGWMRVYVALIVCTLMAGFVIIALGTYSRKAHVSGFLFPDKGLIKVIASHGGKVTDLRVAEGQHVIKDDVLAILDVGAVTMAGRTGDLVVQNLKYRRKLISDELERLNVVQASERDKVDETILSLQSQLTAAEAELKVRQRFLNLANNAFDRNKNLAAQAIYSAAQKERAEQDMVSAAAQVATLERAAASSRGELAQYTAEKRGLADRQANDRSQLERALAEIDQQVFQIEDQRYLVLRASASGTATGVVAAVGAAVDTASPLLTIVPDGARLQANLYVPSSAAGFVKVGAVALLRYEAYPYQKFGTQEAIVQTISRTSLNGRELPFPISSADPLYLITAQPKKMSVTAFGHEEPLRPGAKFQADLILEERKLWEWAIEPLLAARASF